MARFLVQTIPNKLPELLINLSSQGPHLMGATLPTLLRAVHPDTVAMTANDRLRAITVGAEAQGAHSPPWGSSLLSPRAELELLNF